MKSKLLMNSMLLFVLGVASCSQPEAVVMPYQPTSTIHDFMYWALDPAVDVIWDSAGVIVTEEGETDLRPTTQEGWDHVRNSATLVAEAGNLLMMPGYRADELDWIEYAQGLVRAGLQARDAAMAQDADALFDAGGAIYNVCRACHNKYAMTASNASE
jgi:hypothetical protein